MADPVNKDSQNEKEINEILDQLNENSGPLVSRKKLDKDDSDVIRKPRGASEEPESLEGLLEKISEKSEEDSSRKKSLFQRILAFFKK